MTWTFSYFPSLYLHPSPSCRLSSLSLPLVPPSPRFSLLYSEAGIMPRAGHLRRYITVSLPTPALLLEESSVEH